MKIPLVIKSIAICALVAILVLSVLFALGSVSFKNYKIFLVIATMVWFGCILLSKRRI